MRHENELRHCQAKKWGQIFLANRSRACLSGVFSTGKFALIRVPQYWIIGVKGGCKGTEYSKVLKKPLSSSTGIVSDTHPYIS